MSSPEAFKKWSAWKSGFRMASWMTFYLFLFLSAVYAALTLFLNYLIYENTWRALTEYSRAVVEVRDFPLLFAVMDRVIDLVFVQGRYIFLLATPVWFLFLYIIYRLKKGSARMYEPEYVAGAYLKPPRAIMKKMKKKEG